MSSQLHSLHFGTRGSSLALWQTQHVIELLRYANPSLQIRYDIIKTHGDQLLDTPLPLIGGKGVFTAELETALKEKRIDCAVHSLKDLPIELTENLVIGAIPVRVNPADALISRNGYTLTTLPTGSRIGTSSPRRVSQLLHRRPDLKLLSIRGNIDNRIQKAFAVESEYDAIILAYAGLERLGLTDVISEILDLDDMLPAPGQGAIAVQTRNEVKLLETLQLINHSRTVLAVEAERAFLAGLGGGCAIPIAAYAYWHHNQLLLRGRVSSPDGIQQMDVQKEASPDEVSSAQQLGLTLAQEALSQGATALMGGNL